jgi:lipoate-protein ligase A
VILWCDGAHGAVENMRRDALLLDRAERPSATARGAVLRLFRFDPPGITLGRAQQPERELDLERCRRDRIEWVVRPTGGRAIFHAEAWTFSLTAALDDPEWGGPSSASYDRVARLIHRSLVALGVPAELASHRRGAFGARAGAPPAHERLTGGACFASTARHEIVLEGRKLAGIAQRRTGSALLLQGSVLLGEGHLRLAEYGRGSEAQRARQRAALASATRHAGAFLEAAPLGRWAEALHATIGSSVERVEGAQGAFLLTAEKLPSYTSSVFP